jgi:hypothetical protein
MTTPDPREVIVTFRMTPEQNQWLSDAADRERISTSQMIRKALGIYLFGGTGNFEVLVEPKPIIVKCNRPHYPKCTRRHKRQRRPAVGQIDGSAA